MSGSRSLDAMSEPRRSILLALKHRGALGIADLAERVGITYEGVRQHLGQLELEGWIARGVERRRASPGRRRALYRLTTAGDHLFPKAYDDLAIALLDASAERLGPEAQRQLLAEVARKKVEEWRPLVEGKPLAERLEALRGIYRAEDPYCQVHYGDDGGPRLVEMNCPFLEVARRRPALCSVTVSALRHLLGRRVVRSERFQDGDGRCVFRVLEEEVDGGGEVFEWEPEPDAGAAGEPGSRP